MQQNNSAQTCACGVERRSPEKLDPAEFWQIHRATIVNMNAVAEVSRDSRGHPILHLKKRRETLAVSQPFAHLFKQM